MLNKSLLEGNVEFQSILEKLKDNPNDWTIQRDMVMVIASLESESLIDEAIKIASEISEGVVEMWKKSLDQFHGKDIQNQNKKEEVTKESSFHVTEDEIVEQIYRDGKCLFLVYNKNTEEIKETKTFEDDKCIIKPLSGREIENETIKLPSGTAEYRSTTELLDEIKKHLSRYVDVSDKYLTIASCYVLVTWLYDKFQTIPYLRALGDTGCGKSRFLNVVGGLCYKPMLISGAVTTSPIFRIIERWGGTFIIDEADMKSSDLYNGIINILNCGFEKGKNVTRADSNNHTGYFFYKVYCPKLLATRRDFDDKALESRCLTEVMRETNRDDIPFVLNKRFHEEQEKLRNKLLLYRFNKYFKIDPDDEAKVGLTNIEPRLQQISHSMLIILADEENSLSEFKAYLSEHQQEVIKERSTTIEGQVIQTLFMKKSLVEPFNSNGTEFLPISSKDIADELKQNQGLDSIDAIKVGKILKGLGISTKSVRIPEQDKTKRCVIYDENRFKNLGKRYIWKDDTDSDSVSLVSSVSSVTGNTGKD